MNEDIRALNELRAKATQGTWIAAIREPLSGTENFEPHAVHTSCGPRMVPVGRGLCIAADDARLVAVLVNSWPKISLELEALRKVACEARELLEMLHWDCSFRDLEQALIALDQLQLDDPT